MEKLIAKVLNITKKIKCSLANISQSRKDKKKPYSTEDSVLYQSSNKYAQKN